MIARKEILDRIREIPTLPASASKALAILQDPNAETEVLFRVIQHEPSIATNVLRMANSAYFGRSRSVSSIKEAIVRLGLKNVLRVVLTSSIQPMTNQPVVGYNLAQGELWEHSVTTAVGAETFAQVLGLKVPEYTFTAGLVHDVGKIVLSGFVQQDLLKIQEYAFGNALSFEEAERQVMGIDHAEAGALLLEQWSFPACIIDVVRWHQEPESAPSRSVVIDLVHVADALAMTGGAGTGSDGLNYRLSREVVSRLGITIHLAETVVCKAMGAVAELRMIFSSDPAGR